MTPAITDDDNGTITATVDGTVVRSWQYGLVGNGVNGRTYRMALAREYAEGWHDCAAKIQPRKQRLQLALHALIFAIDEWN